MSIIKFWGRNIVFPVVCAIGAERLFSRNSPFSRLILCYHGVDRVGNSPLNGRHIPAVTFEKHLRYFKKHFEVVPAASLFDNPNGPSKGAKKQIAITFDDGYENNYEFAFPLLKKYDVPATFFVSSVCLEQSEAVLWTDLIDLAREGSGLSEIKIAGRSFRRHGKYRMSDPVSGEFLDAFVKKLSVSERGEFISELQQMANLPALKNKYDPIYWRLMNSGQVREIASSGLVEIGSHGHDHFNLGLVPEEKATEELQKSKQLLEKATGKPVDSIAFPDGSYSDPVKKICRDLGYKHLLAVNYLLPSDQDDKTILRRSGVSGTTNFSSQIIRVHAQFKKQGV